MGKHTCNLLSDRACLGQGAAKDLGDFQRRFGVRAKIFNSS